MTFEWDHNKNGNNKIKHSHKEERYFCIGKISENVASVRFTMRDGKIRIIGAGYWREGRKLYEEKYTI